MAIPGNLLSQVTEQVDPNTSGWTAMLNSTIGLGSGGRARDGCLEVKSVAAGEMRARTVSSYPIVAGTSYEVFADASGSSVPERIGIRWLTAAGAEISITWSLTVSAASTAWHRIAVSGPAPSTAVRAQVVVSSTATAAAQSSYYENVYLGLPFRTLGNLLDTNVESPQTDASGWVVDTNATLARQLPPVSWTVDNYTAGGHVLALTVTANGAASIKSAVPAGASAGTEYAVYAYLNAPTTGSACWIEARFVDGAGTVLGTQRSQLAAPGTGWYRQIASAPAPAGTTGLVVAIGITAGTAGQVVRADTVVVVDTAAATGSGILAALPVGTIVPLADASFEQGVGSWTVTSGTATIARSSPWATSLIGAYSLKLTSVSASTSAVTSGRWTLDPGAGGQPFALIYGLNVAVTGWSFQDFLVWYDTAGAVIQTDHGPPFGLGVGWWRNTSDYIAPAGAASVQARVQATAPASGAVLLLDAVSVGVALPLMDVDVIEETASIRLTRRGLDTTGLLSVWRSGADGVRTLVRGPSGLLDQAPITAETVVIEDYEAPLGVAVSYYAEVRDSAGKVVETETWGAQTIPAPGISMCWLKDPGNPQRNMTLMVPADGGPDWTQPVDQAAYVVKGRRNKVTRSGIRNGDEGDLHLWTQSDDERTALDLLLSSGNVLLWQTAPTAGVGDKYVAVGQVTKARAGQDADDPWRTWTLPLVEADMPVTTGVNGSAGRTWQDILTEFGTWAEVRDTFATWEDVFLNRRKG